MPATPIKRVGEDKNKAFTYLAFLIGERPFWNISKDTSRGFGLGSRLLDVRIQVVIPSFFANETLMTNLDSSKHRIKDNESPYSAKHSLYMAFSSLSLGFIIKRLEASAPGSDCKGLSNTVALF